jgi:hypothetical protein
MDTNEELDEELPKDICLSCNKEVVGGDFYLIYRLTVITNENTYHVGLQKFIEDLGLYSLKSGFHLSGSEILLLRPDIVKIYLNSKYNKERVEFWFLKDFAICTHCYEFYKMEVPL